MYKDNSSICKRCGKPIRFIPMKSGKVMPVDAEIVRYIKVEKGKDRIVTPLGEVVCGTILKREFDSKDKALEKLGYISHFATCAARK